MSTCDNIARPGGPNALKTANGGTESAIARPGDAQKLTSRPTPEHPFARPGGAQSISK